MARGRGTVTKSRHILLPRKRWTDAELAILRSDYPERTTALIAEQLGRALHTVYQKAMNLGLRKSEAFNALPASGRLLPSSTRGLGTRFKPGQVPPNKGLRRPGWAPGRMSETQFKKGRRPEDALNYLPIGSLRVSRDGYLERKVTDDQTLVPARRWVCVHRLVWIEQNGPVPQGHVICFRRGRQSSELAKITLDAIECISRKELARRNRMWVVYPKPLASLIHLRGQLKRRIRQKESHVQNNK